MRAPMLSPDTERALFDAWKAGDRRAYEYLIFAHIRMAAPYCRRGFRAREDTSDIIQEATLGILRALENFDPSRGFRFSTFAGHYVREKAHREWDRAASILKRPATASAKAYLMHQSKHLARVAASADPVGERAKISREVGISADLMASCDAWAQIGLGTPLSAPAREGYGDETLGDRIVDPRDAFAEAEEVEEREVKMRRISDALRTLPDRSRAIVEARFTGDIDDVPTLEVLARRFGITRERVRQIEVKALAEIRSILNIDHAEVHHAGREPSSRERHA